ncbi:MAG: hypothetical protein PHR35_15555 [Kiritimatiellae bacterium]|nr:hypothetical protein [Kiritimatiellia bacterium]
MHAETRSENWEVLTAELKRYEYEIGPTGQISYRAPEGYHDDCVMALALATHRRWETQNCGNMLRVGVGRGVRMRRRPLRAERELGG